MEPIDSGAPQGADAGYSFSAPSPVTFGRAEQPAPTMPTCPECGSPTLVMQSGCASCLSCDYSVCG